jgi:uncharacterized protein with NRDE domain
MCSVIILWQPGDSWPVLIAANRDEMADRDWKKPGRHWPDRPNTMGGKDVVGNGTWLAMNDSGVVAGVLNRMNTLGPAPGFRSRGEIPLKAVDQPNSKQAVETILEMNAGDYRPFNGFVVDQHAGYWFRGIHNGDQSLSEGHIDAFELETGISLITAHDRNDISSARIRRYLPLFERARKPNPDANQWEDWINLLSSQETEPGSSPKSAMNVVTGTGFGTVSSSLIALPSNSDGTRRPIWLFAGQPPDQAVFERVVL